MLQKLLSPVLVVSAVLALASAPAAQTTHVVTNSGFQFNPIEVRIQVGDTVRWNWSGVHNVESGYKGGYDGNFTSGGPQSGGTFQVTFNQAYLNAHPMPGDQYPYYCITHLFVLMYGSIIVERPNALSADTAFISSGSGGSQNFELDAGPAFAGHLFWMLGSSTGTTPGLTNGAINLPLNLNSYFLFTLSNPNVLLTPSIGLLDGQGRASMSYVFPPGVPQVASFTLHHAYMVLDPVTLELVDASNAWPLTFLN